MALIKRENKEKCHNNYEEKITFVVHILLSGRVIKKRGKTVFSLSSAQ